MAETEQRRLTKAAQQCLATLGGSRPFAEVEAEWIAQCRPVAPPKIVCRICGAAAINGADLRRVSPGIFECRAGHEATR
jgi:hypothetical protein